MDVDNMDYNSEVHKIEKKIDHYKSKLRNCRDKYENIETTIYNVRRLQSKSLFVLNNVQPMEEDINERFTNIHLNYEVCVEKSGGHKDLDETIRAKINELTLHRNTLMQELAQLRKNADDNNKKLARVKAMITEQEVNDFNITIIIVKLIYIISLQEKLFLGKERDTASKFEGKSRKRRIHPTKHKKTDKYCPREYIGK